MTQKVVLDWTSLANGKFLLCRTDTANYRIMRSSEGWLLQINDRQDKVFTSRKKAVEAAEFHEELYFECEV